MADDLFNCILLKEMDFYESFTALIFVGSCIGSDNGSAPTKGKKTDDEAVSWLMCAFLSPNEFLEVTLGFVLIVSDWVISHDPNVG